MDTPTTNTIITPIDLGYRNLVEGAAATLVTTDEGPVLVDCGPAKCIETLQSGLEAQGSSLKKIRHVLLTHVHLDHGGATGHLAAAGAQIYVHPRGAPHLVDPTKLNASSRRVFGDEFDVSLKDLLASPAEQVHVVEDGETVKIGQTRFQAIETLGHAKHHHAWLMDNGAEQHLFAGDIAAMRIPGSDFATLPLFAPDFDRDLWLDSIERIRKVDTTALWLAHFGRVTNQSAFLDQVAGRVQNESDFITAMIDSAPDAEPEALIPEYRAWHSALANTYGVDQARLDHYCQPRHYRANIIGVGRWHARRD